MSEFMDIGGEMDERRETRERRGMEETRIGQAEREEEVKDQNVGIAGADPRFPR